VETIDVRHGPPSRIEGRRTVRELASKNAVFRHSRPLRFDEDRCHRAGPDRGEDMISCELRSAGFP
jgi:hypothetical protein